MDFTKKHPQKTHTVHIWNELHDDIVSVEKLAFLRCQIKSSVSFSNPVIVYSTCVILQGADGALLVLKYFVVTTICGE